MAFLAEFLLRISRQWNTAPQNPCIKIVRHGGDGYFSKKQLTHQDCFLQVLPRRKEWWQEFSCQFQPQRIQNNILTFEIIGAVTVPDADWHIDGQWVLAITQCFLLLWKLVGVFLVWRKSVIGEEMETTHGEFTGPGAGGAGQLHPQHAGHTPAAPSHGALQVAPPTSTDQAPRLQPGFVHGFTKRWGGRQLFLHMSILPRKYCPDK